MLDGAAIEGLNPREISDAIFLHFVYFVYRGITVPGSHNSFDLNDRQHL